MNADHTKYLSVFIGVHRRPISLLHLRPYCLRPPRPAGVVKSTPAALSAGCALTYSSFGACLDAWRTPSKTKKRTDSSMPTRPKATPRSFRIPAIRWYGLSSSCHTRISSTTLISSRARISSNPGSTHAGSPVSVNTTAKVRSLRPQRTPVRYIMAAPDSSTTARSPNSFMASCNLAMRARYVSAETSVVCCGMGLSKRLIDRRALLRKHARTFLGDVHAIFQTDTELAVDGDGRFVAEAHPRLDLRCISLHQVGPLVRVQPDSVPGAMRQSRCLVPGAETRAGDHLARRRVHALAGGTGPRRRQRRILRPPLQVPHFALPLGRLAEHRGARDVALIAFHAAPIVDQHHVALAQLLRLYAAVRERRVFAENRHRRPAHPQRAQGLRRLRRLGGSPYRFAPRGQNPRLPRLPLAGEIVHAGAALQVDGGHLVDAHQPPRFLHARRAFPVGDRLDAVQHGLQFADGFGLIALLRRGHARNCGGNEDSSIHGYTSSVGFRLCQSVACS